ncbi:hypothetical protein KIW84_061676 [Lathyrus oleraceus]|uniref:Uncharacterized protein n=1 Tax=Pisum sativum TaxID=3888 RepID=A0A9D4W569_PEA|nr:hypothetical protein KIW84_061676 [Pisum sativum]
MHRQLSGRKLDAGCGHDLRIKPPSTASSSFSITSKCSHHEVGLANRETSANKELVHKFQRLLQGANSSHSDANISPLEVTQVPPSNAETTSTCYTVISTKRVMVSPAKQMAYIESSHYISLVKTNSDKAFKREQVRSRLNFDSSDVPQRSDSDKSLPNEISTTESNNEVQLYDIDFPNFDALSMNFSFAEMLNDLDFSCEGLDFSCDPTPIHSNDNQVISEQPSTLAEALSEKNMNIQGTDSLTAMAFATRNVTILSPEKKAPE